MSLSARHNHAGADEEKMRNVRFTVAMANAGGGTPPPHPPPGGGEGGPQGANGAPPAAELHGWKEIAAALGTNVRTAQKYESRHGLPVRRMPGKRGRVYALRDEILAWRDQRRLAEPEGLMDRLAALSGVRLASAAGAAVAALIGALLIFWNGSPPVASLRWNGPVLEALDARGRVLWGRSFPSPPANPSPNPAWTMTELLEGERRLLVFHQPSEAAPARLFCFSDGGTLEWRYPPPARSGFGLRLRAFAPLPPEVRSARVAVALLDEAGTATQIRLLGADGEEAAAITRPGVFDKLATADPDISGTGLLLAGGFDRERGQAALLRIGVSTPPASRQAAVSVPARPEVAVQGVALFPRTRLNRRLDLFNRVAALRTAGDLVVVRVQEAAGDAWVEYRLGLDLSLRGVAVSDALKRAFRREFVRGTLGEDWSASDEEALVEGFALLPP